MGHHISAIVLKGHYQKDKAEKFDLRGIELPANLHLFFTDHHYSACWQAMLGFSGQLETHKVDYLLFPSDRVLSEIMKQVSGREKPLFAIICTDYFGGFGQQVGNVYEGDKLADRNVQTINEALAFLGLEAEEGKDEFETAGLHKFRENPEYLDKYFDMADELGV